MAFLMPDRLVTPQDNRRVANGEQVSRVAGLALMNKPLVDFTGYWQSHQKDTL